LPHPPLSTLFPYTTLFRSTLLKTTTRFDRPHSPVTVRRHYNMLNQIFNMANRERLINDNPCREVSRTVLKQLPTWQNRERWLNKDRKSTRLNSSHVSISYA